MRKTLVVAVVLLLLLGGGCSSGGDSATEEPTSPGANAATSTPGQTATSTVQTGPGGEATPPVTSTGGGETGQSASTPATGDQSPIGQPPSQTSQPDEVEFVELVPGQSYSGGTQVGSSTLGVSFEIPQDWLGGIPQGAEALMLGSNTRPGLVLAIGQQSTDVSEVVATMSQPVPLDNSIVLMPQGQPQVSGRWVNCWYFASDGFTSYTGYAMALVDPDGKGVLFIAAGPQGEADYYQTLVNQMASTTQTISFSGGSTTTAQGDAGDESSQVVQEWIDFLAGQRMTYMSSASSFSGGVDSSTRRDMYLCRDGRFIYEDESLISIDSGSGSGGQESDTGRWRIVTQGGTVGIELTWDSGGESAHLLEYVNGETHLDGERWFVTPENPYC